MHDGFRDPAQGEPRKRLTRMRYNAGPMAFLSDQIMKEMHRAGYPAVEHSLFRSPAAQLAAFQRQNSRAGPYNSAHQYWCAADVIHERWAWFAKKDHLGRATGAPDGEAFWDRLWDCVGLVSEKYSVEFSKRLTWDPAHVELANWRDFKTIIGRKEPSQLQLNDFFFLTLPKVWKAHLASAAKRGE